MRSSMAGFGLIAALAIAGCVKPRVASGGAEVPGTAAANAIVTARELSRFEHSSLATALGALRPWLHSQRGAPLRVSVDGAPSEELRVLELIRVADVAEVRLIRGSLSAEARATRASNGDLVTGDVLLVTRRTQE